MGAASGAGRGQTAEVPLADALSLVDGHDVDDESENRWKMTNCSISCNSWILLRHSERHGLVLVSESEVRAELKLSTGCTKM